MSQEQGEAGTSHIQGYCQFKQQLRLSAVKRLLSPRAHLEVAKGGLSENKTYITKEAGEPHYVNFEWGEGSTAGERKDLAFLRGQLLKGRTYEDLVRLHPEQFGNLVRYHRGLERIAEAFEVPRGTGTTGGTWLYGPTGSGKTFDAIGLASYYGSVYYKSDSSKWWPGYHGQDCIVWDDIRSSSELCANHILRMLDTGDHQVERKGGYKQFKSKHVIFTSPVPPEVFWGQSFLGEDYGQLERRLGNIIEYRGSVARNDVVVTQRK